MTKQKLPMSSIMPLIFALVSSKILVYVMQWSVGGPKRFAIHSLEDVLFAAMIEVLGIVILGGPVIIVVWNYAVVPSFGVDRIGFRQALVVCLLGVVMAALVA